VRELLLRRILDGVYAPGDRIVELEVARELDTSQAPVREALRELQGLRLVTVKPYRGARVREVTDEEMRESFDVRAVLEELAASRAAEAIRGCTADLRTAVEGMRTAATVGDCDAFVRNDLAFHRTIVSCADRGTLLHVWESVGVEVRIRMLLKRSGVDLEPVAEAHEPIVDAIERGDRELAGRLLRSHPEAIYGLAALGAV
jgi:DNA-binding GntR family transcriptional regulator